MTPADPPLLTHLLFEKPTGLIVLLLVTAGVLLLAAGRGRRRPTTIIAAGLIAASVGVFALARSVQTRREQLIGATETLIGHVAQGNLQQVRQMLDPRAFCSYYDGSPWLRFEQIIPKIQWAHRTYPIRSHRARGVEAEARTEQQGITQVTVHTVFESSQPIDTTWLLTWVADTDGHWRVTQIQWLRLQGTRVTPAVAP